MGRTDFEKRLFGLVLLAVGIWLGVDRNFMTTIIGNNLYAAAVFLILAGGVTIFFISFFGCCGVIRENKIFLKILMFCYIIIKIGDKVKETMSSTLTDFYGVNFQNEYNRAVTDAWDKAQERLKCCGVTKEGWYIYRNSNWFKSFGSLIDREIIYEECTNDQLASKLWVFFEFNAVKIAPGSIKDVGLMRHKPKCCYVSHIYNVKPVYQKPTQDISSKNVRKNGH
ncbi:hypothetical protein HELRODRAFT_167698 [Helobdella robusta]|uniref:Tetraspanin n=1 Tax=Helobdella robusta TaxID=6412 RepID=T1EZP4_HELRO|nr:hypothetical protein HELRODRAFT_167698 [Helobdella robusta]ESO09881.1 hypothetical protein HELRODRAFT_167698 [Helobdella robusta]